jgi:hypothetical protein
MRAMRHETLPLFKFPLNYSSHSPEYDFCFGWMLDDHGLALAHWRRGAARRHRVFSGIPHCE